MKRILTLLLLAAVLPLSAAGQHQVRLGWGDMLFETLAFHPGYAADGKRTSDFCYTGHFFAEYSYQLTPVTGIGIKSDLGGIFWKETPCDIYRAPIGESSRVRNHNLSFIPTAQFTFLKREHVELYAGIGAGLLVAFDNKGDAALSPVLDLNILGVRAGKGPWWGAVEFGGLNALTGANTIYLLGSRLVSISLNYRW